LDIVTAQIDAFASRKRRSRDLLAAEDCYPPASSRRVALSRFAADMMERPLSGSWMKWQLLQPIESRELELP
jgi:hypothetical protein